MIPLFLNPKHARIALAGRGALALKRMAWLAAADAAPEVWSDEPSPELSAAAGGALNRRLPSGAELRGLSALWIADLPHDKAEALAQAARAQGVLVNVEDAPLLCDFHTPAVVRRGRLTLAAGTGGASPAVARAVRERLEAAFGDGWETALEEIAQSRLTLRAQGATFEALVADARARLAAHGLH
jgi:precorrin-2 dehydrogenase/sirohydrochlorin ferrochelatase